MTNQEGAEAARDRVSRDGMTLGIHMTERSERLTVGVNEGETTAAAEEELPAWLVEMLICPGDGGSVRVRGGELVCQRCGRRYPVRDGIPVMITEEAETEHKF